MRLYADSLLSKWGFEDGDILADYVNNPLRPLFIIQTAEHDALVELVRTHLLPALDQKVEVYTLETIHNPIRANTIDGVTWYEDDDRPVLTPEYVEVSDDQVIAMLVKHGFTREEAS